MKQTLRLFNHLLCLSYRSSLLVQTCIKSLKSLRQQVDMYITYSSDSRANQNWTKRFTLVSVLVCFNSAPLFLLAILPAFNQTKWINYLKNFLMKKRKNFNPDANQADFSHRVRPIFIRIELVRLQTMAMTGKTHWNSLEAYARKDLRSLSCNQRLHGISKGTLA